MSSARCSGEAQEGKALATWDAGDLGCGELVLELRERLAALHPGAMLRLVARDAGAPAANGPEWRAGKLARNNFV